jgi:hypothetical protein
MSLAMKFMIALIFNGILVANLSASAHATEPGTKARCFSVDKEIAVIKNLPSHNFPKTFTPPDLIADLTDNRQLLFANIKIAMTIKASELNYRFKGLEVTLHPSGRLKDHRNRLLRQVIGKSRDHVTGQSGKPVWLQKWLVEKGEALVYAQPSNYKCAVDLLATEKAARKQQRGQWQQGGDFKIYTATEIEKLNHLPQGSFQLVRGKLHSVTIRSKTTYLNFSENWRKDFTVLIDTRLLRRKDSRWPNLKSLEGKTLLVRGWLDHWNGPMIRLHTAEMMSIE